MSGNQAIADMSYQNYDTNNYFTESTPVDIHPIDGSVMPEPYSSTFKKVPDPIPVNKWPKFVNNEWVLVDNFIGTIYWDEFHIQRLVEKYEETVPAGSFMTDPGPRLVDVQASVLEAIKTNYQRALASPVPFTTTEGVLGSYQHDTESMQTLTSAITSFSAAGELPQGYYWLDANNERIGFTLPDLIDLCSTLSRRNFELFSKLQDYKDAVRSATSVAQALAILWRD